MEFYYCEYTTYHNGTKINMRSARYLLDTKPVDKVIDVTWNNLIDVYHELGLNCAFNVWNFKKGRLVSFFTNKLFAINGNCADVKEWKQPNLNITIKVTYEKISPSIETILKWPNGDEAIAYLKEKGLKLF